MRIFIFIAFYLIFIINTSAQVKITEVGAINPSVINDEVGDDGDYIEIFNRGASSVNIGGWSLSDNNTIGKWRFPTGTILPAQSRILVFADEKNYNFLPSFTQPVPNHWETAIKDSAIWQYYEGITSEPQVGWQNIVYTPTIPWQTGKGGFGFGDGDDSTTISNTATSVYIRKTFTVANKADLVAAIVSLDYDDGCAVYLNGTLIGVKNINSSPIYYYTLADIGHEAVLYGNSGSPDTIRIDNTTLQNLLVNGTNVLAIQCHNVFNTSSDLTCRAWLHFGVASSTTYYSTNNPYWFVPTNYNVAQNVYHTNFKLSDNESIKLHSFSNVLMDSVNTGTTYYGVVRARIPDTSSVMCYTTTLTPSSTNNIATCLTGITPQVNFSLVSGHYTTAQSLILSTSPAGYTIRYTTNGDAPTSSSTLYTGPINISNTRVIRAAAFLAGHYTSPPVSNTYFINESTTLPVVSLILDSANMSAYATLTVFDNLPPETYGHFEYYAPNNGALLFQQDCGIKQNGKGSTFSNSKPLKITAKKIYGNSEFDYKFFDDVNYSKFNELIFRNGGNDTYLAHIRDYLSHKALGKIGFNNQITRPVLLYTNGVKYGIMFMKESLDEYYVKNRSIIQKDSANIVRQDWINGLHATNGTLDSFTNFINDLNTQDLSIEATYNTYIKKINKKNFIDYFASEIYMANTDWMFNNMRIFSDLETKKPWELIAWDLEWGYNLNQVETHNTLSYATTFGNSWSVILNSYLENANFKRDFINRMADLLNTVYRPDTMHALMLSCSNQIATDYVNYVTTNFISDSTSWAYNLESVDNFLQNRPALLRDHFSNDFVLNGIDTISLAIYPPGAGTIEISTINPRTYPWKGYYFNGNPVNIKAKPNPGYRFTHWNANNSITNVLVDSFYGFVNLKDSFVANFVGAAIPNPIYISEINYNSHSSTDAGDWIEIYNNSNFIFDISSYTISGNSIYNKFIFPKGTKINPREFILIIKDSAKFNTINPFITSQKFYEPNFELSNKAEKISLLNNFGANLESFDYADSLMWPRCADGNGRTLERKVPFVDGNNPLSWFDGCMNGSPGKAYSHCNEPLVFNEIQYFPGLANNAGEWIEIKNNTNTNTSLSLWELRDENDYVVFQFSPTATVSANGYLVVYSNATNFNTVHPGVTNATGPFRFDLGNNGELLRLFDQNKKIMSSIYYRDLSPWTGNADGIGPSLELNSIKNINIGNNWDASCGIGTPGVANSLAQYTNSINIDSIFIGDTLTLTNTTTGVATWFTPTGIVNNNVVTINGFSVTNNGSYLLSVNNAGCINRISFDIYARPKIKLNAKTLLAGNYNNSTQLMNDNLRSSGMIPLMEPYSSAPYNTIFKHINLGGGEATTNAVLSTTGSNAIVDWVWVELRYKNDSARVLTTKSALLQADGDIVDLNGTSPLTIKYFDNDSFYVSIKHRNHLGFMTQNKILINNTATLRNFSDTAFKLYTFASNSNLQYGGAGRVLNGKRYMFAGNTNIATINSAFKSIKYNGISNDRLTILSAVGSVNATVPPTGSIYSVYDINLDGIIRYNGLNNDRLIILQSMNGNINGNIIQQIPE